jgi:hypothetical protein
MRGYQSLSEHGCDVKIPAHTGNQIPGVQLVKKDRGIYIYIYWLMFCLYVTLKNPINDVNYADKQVTS